MRLPLRLVLLPLSCLALTAAPLSKQLEIDFYREVPGRSLQGLAVRSDGRLLDGPALRPLTVAPAADLLWTLVPGGHGEWFVGTGPEGKIFRLRPQSPDAAPELVADLEATHVFALAVLPDGALLAGTSPQGTLTLIRGGRTVASVKLPSDSVFDLLPLPGTEATALVTTGNPGRIYRVDLSLFAASGTDPAAADDAALAARGITLWGEIRDRNVRRLLPLSDGRIAAGSAPRGNVYLFAPTGGAPRLLLENRDAEVTDLIAAPDGSFYAALTFAGQPAETRVTATRPTLTPTPVTASPAPAPESIEPPLPEPTRAERFSGRGQIVHFPVGGLPETLVSRTNLAFYRLAWHEFSGRRWLLIGGGEQGELLAYDHAERRSLNLGALPAAQLNSVIAQPGLPGRFLALHNNAAGLSEIDFTATGSRSIETRKLDLGIPAELGQLRFARAADAPAGLHVALRTSFASDELEGWSAWTDLHPRDGGWFAPGLQGRYVQVRVTLGAGVAAPQLERATLHYLPQNRRPQLADFRIFPANLGIVPAPEPATPAGATLGQLLNPSPRDGGDASARRRSALMNSQLVPQPGAQLVFWSLSDPDDDALVASFAIAREGSEDWIELAVETAEPFVQFDVRHIPEGRYRSRLIVREQAPRPVSQRLSHTFETDALVVDRTPPEILEATAILRDGRWIITVEAVDSFSLLEGAEFVLNNGVRTAVEHPSDGILDSRRETFATEFAAARAAGATSVEILVYDQAGNSAARRLPLER